jgi:SAM-dependent methyltransferase
MNPRPSRRRELGRRAKRVLLRAPLPFKDRLLLAAWRGYESLQARAGKGTPSANLPPGSERWPIPPPRLRVLVSGDADLQFFLRSGSEQVNFIRELLAEHGVRLEELERVLDFGCGCGRLARWWPERDGLELHGCDYNPELVEWCQANLPFMVARVSGLEPPLPYPREGFDLIYALSVFTHLPEPMQRTWVAELRTALRPGGLLFFTVSGTAYLDRLSAEERRSFSTGNLVTHFDEVPGTNLCAAYHPRAYVERELLSGFELIDAIEPASDPSRALASLAHDTYLARRPSSPS